jgi:DNA-directed RNA polymerase specialized sigma24 family protein
MSNETLLGSPDDPDLSALLQQLAWEAKQHPSQSPERKQALSLLVKGILKSRHLGHPQKGRWTAKLYEELYNEALQKTLMEICQKIDKYNSAHPVMAWVNFCLKTHFIAVVHDYKRVGITQMPKSEYMNHLPSIDELERDIPTEDPCLSDRSFQEFLQKDPENLLQRERLQNRPDVTFKKLALAKFVDDLSWTEIAAELDIPIQTLCSFFDRKLQKLMPYFQKYLQP